MSAIVHHARRRAAPLPLNIRLRTQVEAAIERLIAMLDAIDGDPDLEPAFGREMQPGEQDEAEAINEDGEETEGDELDAGELDEDEPAWRSRTPASQASP